MKLAGSELAAVQQAIAAAPLDKFLKTFFPLRYDRAFTSAHQPLFELLMDPERRKVAAAAFRSFGKTSILIGYAAKQILAGTKKYIVMCGASGDMAEQSLSENLKWELSENPLIQEVFGDLRTGEWSKDYWIAATGTKVQPVGAGERMRGMNYRGHRPDLLIGDDLENDENVLSDYQRDKLKRWFISAFCKLVNPARKDWKIAVIGTILHEDSLLTNLVESPDWASLRLSVCDDNYQSLYPDFMTDAEVLTAKDEHQRMGLLDEFFREFRSLPISSENAVFMPAMFRYFDEANLRGKHLDMVILCDPARSRENYSADTAIVAVGIDGEGAKIYVRDLECGRYSPTEIIERVVRMAKRWHAGKIGVETTGLLEYITGPLTQEMMKQCYFAQLIEHKSRAAKEDRVGALQPLYKAGAVLHNPITCGILEEQLLAYPRPRRWDAMDVLAYVVEYLPSSFFWQGNAKETREEIEEEYAILRDETLPRLKKDWRLLG